ncbi:hypothetical protein BGI30_08095 [Snodgrassella alvi]|uniref:Uncharacterized protein n=1 Tax=Snodgrassella alvi TaxID=1196083 RepID=A0A855FXX8_9NEIS|nr:hypothetical protein BGI30_08095 [Snodgrassella alvi]PIT56733.1 hypothetical protein BHC59_07605 [Snodgrassella alvi]PIT59111.1 hypothetical protein BHC57_10060 [Snodgrassella alvi]
MPAKRFLAVNKYLCHIVATKIAIAQVKRQISKQYPNIQTLCLHSYMASFIVWQQTHLLYQNNLDMKTE